MKVGCYHLHQLSRSFVFINIRIFILQITQLVVCGNVNGTFFVPLLGKNKPVKQVGSVHVEPYHIAFRKCHFAVGFDAELQLSRSALPFGCPADFVQNNGGINDIPVFYEQIHLNIADFLFGNGVKINGNGGHFQLRQCVQIGQCIHFRRLPYILGFRCRGRIGRIGRCNRIFVAYKIERILYRTVDNDFKMQMRPRRPTR